MSTADAALWTVFAVAVVILIYLMVDGVRDALAHKPHVPVQCPYCSNRDRRSVFAGFRGCQWRNRHQSDPPCVRDDFGTDEQLARLGVTRDFGP